MLSPDISPRIRNLRGHWRNSLVDRSREHSGSYGSRRIGRNVKSEAVQNRIGQTVTGTNTQKQPHMIVMYIEYSLSSPPW